MSFRAATALPKLLRSKGELQFALNTKIPTTTMPQDSAQTEKKKRGHGKVGSIRARFLLMCFLFKRVFPGEMSTPC